MQEDGWLLRNDLIWEKLNPLPCHSPDRRLPVYEHIFHFVKSPKYYFDYAKAKELGHHRDVIKCGIEPYKKHEASFPERLVYPLIETTSKIGDIVLDPFSGSGTVCNVAKETGRKYIGIEINPEYCIIANERLKEVDLFN